MAVYSNNNLNSPFVSNNDIYGKKIVAVPTPPKEIGIDTNNTLLQSIVQAEGAASKLDMSDIQAFTQLSQNRDQVYQMLDTMSEDSSISAILETYAEDATEYNDNGKIVWVESDNPDISAYVQYLLNTLCVDKNIYKWTYGLCKYGDLYLRLYRNSDYVDSIFTQPKEEKTLQSINEKILLEDLSNERGVNLLSDEPSETLEESVKIKAYSKNDKYVQYVEMVPNPAEMFELTKFGKTVGYVQAEVRTPTQKTTDLQSSGYFRYNFKRGDVNIYGATEFVHACLEDNTSRTPEQVNIFVDNESDTTVVPYSVRRGQSLLYNSYKVWRELMLLESSLLLNRVTKSSIVRIIKVKVGDMPKEMVGPHLQGIKSMMEQKSQLDTGNNMGEYTNPGPILNNIYVPVRDNDIGAIDATDVGGDTNVRDIADIDYYMNKFYGSLRVPKQYFSQTDDSTGFNGGSALSIISSRYAKMIKRIQSVMIQAITDVVNLLLLDRDLENYINKFEIHMLPPVTEHEKSRRDAQKDHISAISDIMNLLTDVEDNEIKLKVLKKLLSQVVDDDDVIQLLQEQIDAIDAQKAKEEAELIADETITTDETQESSENKEKDEFNASEPLDLNSDTETTDDEQSESSEQKLQLPKLPMMSELGIDFTNSEQF